MIVKRGGLILVGLCRTSLKAQAPRHATGMEAQDWGGAGAQSAVQIKYITEYHTLCSCLGAWTAVMWAGYRGYETPLEM